MYLIFTIISCLGLYFRCRNKSIKKIYKTLIGLSHFYSEKPPFAVVLVVLAFTAGGTKSTVKLIFDELVGSLEIIR